MKHRLAFLIISLIVLVPALINNRLAANNSPRPITSPTPTSKQPPVIKKSDTVNESNQPTNESSTVSNGPEEIGEDGTVRVNVSLVTVPASVMDRDGKYIFDLKREEFRLYENGIEQEIAFFASTEKPFTVVLMLDVSDSAIFRIDEVKEAAIAFVDQLRADDRGIIVTFSRRVEVIANLTNDKEVLRRAIRSVSVSTGTSLYNAVDMTLHQVLRDVSDRTAIVLFTDGVDTSSLGATYENNMHDAAEAESLIYAVQYDLSPSGKRDLKDGVGAVGVVGRVQRDIANKYLSSLSEKTGGRHFVAKTVQELRKSFAGIAEELRHQYSLGFYRQDLEQQGLPRRIRVRVTRQKVIVRSRPSYGAGPPETN